MSTGAMLVVGLLVTLALVEDWGDARPLPLPAEECVPVVEEDGVPLCPWMDEHGEATWDFVDEALGPCCGVEEEDGE